MKKETPEKARAPLSAGPPLADMFASGQLASLAQSQQLQKSGCCALQSPAGGAFLQCPSNWHTAPSLLYDHPHCLQNTLPAMSRACRSFRCSCNFKTALSANQKYGILPFLLKKGITSAMKSLRQRTPVELLALPELGPHQLRDVFGLHAYNFRKPWFTTCWR